MDSLLEHDDDILNPPWGSYGRDITLGIVSGVSKLLLTVLNKTIVDGLDRFRSYVMHRPPALGLLTYCNHARYRPYY